MSLIESLLFMFDADTRGIDEGTLRAKKSTDDVTDAMKRAEEQSRKTANTLRTFAKGALGWLAAGASAAKIMGMAVRRVGEIDALDSLSQKLGTNITQTDALARSIVELGGSSQQAQQSLDRLATGLLKKGIEPMQGMLDLADELANVSYGEASARLQELQIIDRPTIELMRKGRIEIERLMKQQERNGAITEEAAEKAREFNAVLGKFRTTVNDASASFIQWLMPTLTRVIDELTKIVSWAVENKHFVIGFFVGIASAVTLFFLPAMTKAAVATIAATWPFLAIGAAIGVAAVAFAAIYDDIMTFLDGGESMTGMVLEKFPLVGEAVKLLAQVIQMQFDLMIGAGSSLLTAMQIVVDTILDLLKHLWQGATGWFDLIVAGLGKVKSALDFVAGKLGFDSTVTVDEQAQIDKSVTVRALGESPDDIPTVASIPNIQQVKQSISAAQAQLQTAQAAPAATMTSNTIRNASTSNLEQNIAIGEITIETQATDARGVAQDMRSELQDQLQRMQAENASALTR